MSYDLIALAQRAKAAERMLALASSAQKNQALLAAADALERAANDILAENEKDLSAGRENSLSDALLDRLAPVSYTHLDVYKRQAPCCAAAWMPRGLTSPTAPTKAI